MSVASVWTSRNVYLVKKKAVMTKSCMSDWYAMEKVIEIT